MEKILLLAAPFLNKILWERGLYAFERLMGMILVMMAVQMFINGIQVLF
jgi:multiple antibiotic resistance protein